MTVRIETKIAPFQVDTKGGKPVVKGRSFSGFASTGDLDSQGDIVEPSAFRGTIADWKRTGRLIPLLDQHDGFSSLNKVLGKLVGAEVQKRGLLTTFEIVDSPLGDEALARVKGGYVTGLSIGYRALHSEDLDGELRVVDGRPTARVRRITKIHLNEVSLVVWPANSAARVKHRGLLPDDPKRIELDRRAADLRIRQHQRRVGRYGTFDL